MDIYCTADDPQFIEETASVLKSLEKNNLLYILESRVKELRTDLESLALTESETAAIRGAIGEYRYLIDLFS